MINWSQRYEEEGCEEYDWYLSSSQVATIVESLSREEDEILHVGCGTSTLGEELTKRNRGFVTNIDTCRLVVRSMSQKYAHRVDMQYVEMDATRLPQELTDAFQVVVDKALLDSLLCDQKRERSLQYLNEVHRVIKSGGWFCLISHGLPESRLPLLVTAFNLSTSTKVHVGTIPKPSIDGIEMGNANHFYVYTIRVEKY